MKTKEIQKPHKIIAGGLAVIFLVGTVTFLAAAVMPAGCILKAKLQNRGI